MIRTENIIIGGRTFVCTYSDAGRYVVRDGISYSEANDLISAAETLIEQRIKEG